ncbi:MAG: DcaP family trimeric outer membrane transporter [Steroidobacteraceae bacterium]|nr:DcaP family trimeric outer membrane transporter [Steroidobacteraceae bacterium]
MSIQNHCSPVLRRLVVATLSLAALGASSSVLAQSTDTSAREAALEARVAELEKMVNELVKEKQAPAPAPAAAAVPAGKQPVQSVSILPNAAPGTSLYVTGFVKLDANWTDTADGELGNSASGRDYYVPSQTPIGGKSEGTDINALAKQSRFIVGTNTPLENGDKVTTHFEVDFYGSALGTQNVSNTYGAVLRQAFIQTNHWLVGQAWSTFMDVSALPEAADFIGPTDGVIFIRQPQVRYTTGGFSFAAENPQTTFTTYNPSTGAVTSNSSDDGAFPDFIGRYTWKGDWGGVTLAAMARELKYENKPNTGPSTNASTWSAAAEFTGKIKTWGKDDIRFMLLGGNLGRYAALNFTQDAVLKSNGDFDTIDGFAGYLAYRHFWTDKLRSTAFYAFGNWDNPSALNGTSANQASESWSLNFFYSPIPKLDIGAEYRWSKRELENNDSGTLSRLQLTTKYSF